MLFENFQDGRHGVHLGYHKKTILAILNLYVAPMTPIKFQLNLTYDLGGNVLRIHGHHGCRFGYRKGTILAILHLYVDPMPSIKFGLNLTYGLGDVF